MKIKLDAYVTIAGLQSSGVGTGGVAAEKQQFGVDWDWKSALNLIDYESLAFELESYKARQAYTNFIITIEDIKNLLRAADLPKVAIILAPSYVVRPRRFEDRSRLQRLILTFLKTFMRRVFEYARLEFIEPRLGISEMSRDYSNLPAEDEHYVFTVDPNTSGTTV